MNTPRSIINFLEIIARAIISIICVSIPIMILNVYKYKCTALVIFVLLSVVVAGALHLLIKRRRIATSEDELDSMFPQIDRLAKYGSELKLAAVLALVALLCMNTWCGIGLLSRFTGVDMQLSEEYEISEDAIAVMRSIPGTFAGRVYYVVTTPMDDFDYEFYNNLVRLDHLIAMLTVSYGVLETVSNNIRLYNMSLRSMEDANY